MEGDPLAVVDLVGKLPALVVQTLKYLRERAPTVNVVRGYLFG